MTETTSPVMIPTWDKDDQRRISKGVWEVAGVLYRLCPRCKMWLEQDLYFHYSGRRYASYCKECRQEYNKTIAGPRWKEVRRRLKRRCLALCGGKCAKCGCNNPVVLDFHHINKEESKRQRKAKWSRRRRYYHVIKHPEEYMPLCKNCHYLEHYPYGEPLHN